MLESKLVRAKFGAEGYGIMTALIEVVGENMCDDNVEDWGHVHPLHTIETLAEECAVTPEKLREFLTYTNKIKLFERTEKGLFYKIILSRLDNYGSRERRKYEVSTNQVRSKFDIQYSTEQDSTVQNSTTHITYLKKIPDEDLKEFTKRFVATEKQIKSKAEELMLYCQSKGKIYRNYKAFLLKALKRDYKERDDTPAGGKYKDL